MSGPKIVRRVIRAVGRNRSFVRRLPPEFGSLKFVTSTEGGLKLLHGDLLSADPPLTAFVRNWVRPGQTVWDIGANVGLFTFLAAGRVGTDGRVLSVEPDAWLIQILRKGARMNADVVPVDVLGVAIADKNSILNFRIASAMRAVSHLDGYGFAHMTEGSRERQLVPAVTLDWLLSEYSVRPDIIKIDVEGAEALVLAGSSRILQDVRPIMLIEVSAERASEVTEIYKKNGYQLRDAMSSTFDIIDQARVMTIAIPA